MKQGFQRVVDGVLTGALHLIGICRVGMRQSAFERVVIGGSMTEAAPIVGRRCEPLGLVLLICVVTARSGWQLTIQRNDDLRAEAQICLRRATTYEGTAPWAALVLNTDLRTIIHHWRGDGDGIPPISSDRPVRLVAT